MALFSFGRSSTPVGLDVGTNLFRAVQLGPGSDKPNLLNYGSIKVPVGSVVEGEIADTEAAAYALTHLWKTAGFSTRDVVIGVASQRVVVRLVTMPAVDQEELAGVIHFQAQDYIPIPVDEAIIDAQIVSEFDNENEEKMMEVLLVAAQRDMIDNTITAVEQAGLKPQAIDLSAFAVVRSLISTNAFELPDAGDESDTGSAVALINISAGLTNIVVVEEAMPRFARVTPLAGNDLTQAIADSLGLTFEEAEELKIKVGLSPVDGTNPEIAADLPEGLRVHAPAAQSVLENQINHFIAEIRRSLDYYLTQAVKITSIDKLVLSGAGSNLINLPQHLERGLQANVEIGRPLNFVNVSPNLAGGSLIDEEMSLAISVGLALRSFQE